MIKKLEKSFAVRKIMPIFATQWELLLFPKQLKSGLEGPCRPKQEEMIMRNGRKNGSEVRVSDFEYFEYDNVYNLEHDELRADSTTIPSVWYS